MKSLLLRGGIRAGLFFVKFAASLFTAWLVGIHLIPLAAAERGYEGAVGGEGLVIIGVFILTYYLCSRKIRPP